MMFLGFSCLSSLAACLNWDCMPSSVRSPVMITASGDMALISFMAVRNVSWLNMGPQWMSEI